MSVSPRNLLDRTTMGAARGCECALCQDVANDAWERMTFHGALALRSERGQFIHDTIGINNGWDIRRKP